MLTAMRELRPAAVARLFVIAALLLPLQPRAAVETPRPGAAIVASVRPPSPGVSGAPPGI